VDCQYQGVAEASTAVNSVAWSHAAYEFVPSKVRRGFGPILRSTWRAPGRSQTADFRTLGLVMAVGTRSTLVRTRLSCIVATCAIPKGAGGWTVSCVRRTCGSSICPNHSSLMYTLCAMIRADPFQHLQACGVIIAVPVDPSKSSSTGVV
jgi:hypothetical protein